MGSAKNRKLSGRYWTKSEKKTFTRPSSKFKKEQFIKQKKCFLGGDLPLLPRKDARLNGDKGERKGNLIALTRPKHAANPEEEQEKPRPSVMGFEMEDSRLLNRQDPKTWVTESVRHTKG